MAKARKTLKARIKADEPVTPLGVVQEPLHIPRRVRYYVIGVYEVEDDSPNIREFLETCRGLGSAEAFGAEFIPDHHNAFEGTPDNPEEARAFVKRLAERMIMADEEDK